MNRAKQPRKAPEPVRTKLQPKLARALAKGYIRPSAVIKRPE